MNKLEFLRENSGKTKNGMIYKLTCVFCLTALLLFNIIFFVFKNHQVFESQNQRQEMIIDQFIKNNIPKKSKVIGDPLFFYAVINAGSDYQYFDLFTTLEDRELNHRTIYNYDYLIVSEQSKSRDIRIANYYLQRSEFDTLATLKLPQNENSKFVNHLGLVSNMEQYGYSCTIMKRRK